MELRLAPSAVGADQMGGDPSARLPWWSMVGCQGCRGLWAAAGRRRRGTRGDGGDSAVVAADLVKRLGLGGWSWKEEN